MKKMYFLLLVLVGGLMASCKTGNEPSGDVNLPEIKRDFDAITDWFAAAVKLTHPHIQKNWNADADPADFNLLLVNEEKTRICAISPDGKKEWKQTEWPDVISSQVNDMNSFACTHIGDKCYTLILCSFSNYDAMAEVMKQNGIPASDKHMVWMWLELFYHESFHAFVQVLSKDWQKGSGTYNRDQEYPIDYSPRIYRKLALIALKNAWQDESKKAEYYSRAKYWTDKYEKNYASEAAAIKSTDIDEATAEFFSRSIMHAVFSDYVLLHDIDTYNLGRGVDAESYMSSVAIQLLRREGRFDEAIAVFKAQKLTPINCLLKDVPVPANYDEKQDEADMERIKLATDQTEGSSSKFIDPLLKGHKEGKNIYLGLKGEDGSYMSSQGTYTLTELPGISCSVDYETSTSNYEIKGMTIFQKELYYLAPITDIAHLILSNKEKAVDVISPVKGVTISHMAQITELNEESVELKTLPAIVLIGKDSYGNEYYICDFK